MASFDSELRQRIDPQKVNGWGVDADPDNDPTYPYRARLAKSQGEMNWPRPSLQKFDVEILRSIEHNRPPAVSGTSYPPSGLSGTLRRVAFGYSESDWRHWLVLLAADRINMMEGLFQDLGKGIVPNIPKEMGVRAEWTHNKTGLIKKGLVLAAVSAVVFAAYRNRSRFR